MSLVFHSYIFYVIMLIIKASAPRGQSPSYTTVFLSTTKHPFTSWFTSNPELLQIWSFSSSLTLEPISLQISDITIFCDTSTGAPRPFIPIKFCCTVFHSLHSLSHPGIRATQHLITARYVWSHVMSMFQGTITYCYATLHICKPCFLHQMAIPIYLPV